MRPPKLTPLGYLALALATAFVTHALVSLAGVGEPLIGWLANGAIWIVLFVWMRAEHDPGAVGREGT